MAVVLFLASPAFAQTVTGTLQGTVSDSKGAVVAGAEVVIRNVETAQERTVTTTALDLNFDGFGESRPVLLDPSILGNSVNHPATSREALPRTAFRTLTILGLQHTNPGPQHVLRGRC